MLSSIAHPSDHAPSNDQAGGKAKSISAWSPFSTAAVFASLIAVWFAFDYRLPAMDEAGHILNGFSYRDLFAHPAFWQKSWMVRALCVNNFYPPFVYVFNGVLKLVFGSGRWVDVLSLVCFDVVLTIAVFDTALRLTGSRFAACSSSVIINTYPVISFLSRTFFLIFPLCPWCPRQHGRLSGGDNHLCLPVSEPEKYLYLRLPHRVLSSHEVTSPYAVTSSRALSIRRDPARFCQPGRGPFFLVSACRRL